jgi:hypothetical protein
MKECGQLSWISLKLEEYFGSKWSLRETILGLNMWEKEEEKPKESFFVKCGLHETHKKRSDLRMIVFNFPFECFTIV